MNHMTLQTDPSAPWNAGFEIPDYNSDTCMNCFRIVEDVAYFSHRTRSGFLTSICYCEECLPEVILHRLDIRNVSAMTKELVESFNRALAQEEWERVYDATNRTVKHI